MGTLLLVIAIVAVPVYVVARAADTFGWPLLIGGVVAIVVAVSLLKAAYARSVEAERLDAIEARRNALLQNMATLASSP